MNLEGWANVWDLLSVRGIQTQMVLEALGDITEKALEILDRKCTFPHLFLINSQPTFQRNGDYLVSIYGMVWCHLVLNTVLLNRVRLILKPSQWELAPIKQSFCHLINAIKLLLSLPFQTSSSEPAFKEMALGGPASCCESLQVGFRMGSGHAKIYRVGFGHVWWVSIFLRSEADGLWAKVLSFCLSQRLVSVSGFPHRRSKGG